MVKPVTWQEAEKIGGFRVDRRFKYAVQDDGKPCDMSGAVIFQLARWTDTCSGCFESEDGYPIGSYPIHPKHNCYIGAGCSECGYTGLRRQAYWCPHTKELAEIDKRNF